MKYPRKIEEKKGKNFSLENHLFCDYRKEDPVFYFKYKKDKKTFYIYFNGIRDLDAARLKASEYSLMLKRGEDPKEYEENLKAKRQAAEAAAKRAPLEEVSTVQKIVSDAFSAEGVFSDKPKVEYLRSKKHIFPELGEIKIKDLTPADLERCFGPLFVEHPETAKKVYRYLKVSADWARIKGDYGEFDHLRLFADADFLLKKYKATKAKGKNRAALPFTEIPKLIEHLLRQPSSTSLCLIFSILTATRSLAVRNLRWSQIDFKNNKWVIPLEYDKTNDNINHDDPETRTILLSSKAVEFLSFLPKVKDLVFMGPFDSEGEPKPLDASAFTVFLNRLHKAQKKKDGLGFADPKILDVSGEPKVMTQHGTARASFQTWTKDGMGEGKPNSKRWHFDIAEMNLLHAVSSREYDRALMEDERRDQLEAWGQYCMQGINLEDFFPNGKQDFNK